MIDCHTIGPQLRNTASVLLQLAAGISLGGHVLAQVMPISDSEIATAQAGISDPLTAPVADQARVQPDTGDSKTIRDYQEQIDQLESRFGAYHNDLSEVVLGLGLAHQQEGNHEEAIMSINRALHINRVNQGLYHVSKIPLLEQLIVSYSATADWQAVDDSYFTLMQLYARNYDNSDVELLPGLAKLIRWHLHAFSGQLTEQPIKHLLLVRELLFQSIGIIKFNYGANDLRQLEPFAALVLTDYYQAAAQLQNLEQTSKVSINHFREESGKAFAEEWTPYQNMFTQGKHHIEEMIHITQTNAATTPRTAIDVLVMLADWHLIFKKKMTADELYKQVWAQASLPNINISGTSFSGVGDDSASEAKQSVSQGNDNGSQDVTGSTAGQGVIVIEFDITTSGRPVDAEVVEADPRANKNIIIKAKRQLRASRFRPRYENGIAVEAQNTRIRYLFEPDPEQSLAEASNGE
jgi:tetratricopeptide (TPR) repeat protein